MAIVPDLSQPLRNAILSNAVINSMLPVYLDAPTVFTRRPAPPDAPYPMIMVSTDLTRTDQDGINDQRPILTRDIIVYGQNDTNDHYRDAEVLANIVYDIFHHNHQVIVVDSGWSVVNSYCTGPRPAPADDDQHVGRAVTVVTELAILR